jgi:hypothetical protein|tara:strand:+ start:59 stop:586 length:528 start_codon:yes stop_codon:yes gene_type:complete
MACLLTKGRKLPCKSAFGGIKAAYFMDFGDLGDATYTDGEITAITGTPTVYKFDVKGSSSLETTITSSRDTGTTFYTQTLNLTLTYLDNPTQQEIQLIAAARPQIAVEDYYGNMFLVGLENGAECTGGSVVTGTAAGDLSGFTLTMEAMEETAAPFITSTLITGATQGTQIAPTG